MHGYLLRYGEISLKGKNRTFFEAKLAHNLKAYLKNQGIPGTIQRLRNRIYAETEQEIDWKPAFGLVNYSPCEKVAAKYEEIQKKVEHLCSAFHEKTTFRITAHNMDPTFPFSKQELNEKLGALVITQTKAKVDLKNHEEDLGIEILQGHAYIYRKTLPCLGGLPVGVEGNTLLLVEEEKSVLAGLLAMKRGCALYPVAQDKKNLTLLENHAYGSRPTLALLKEINLPEYIKKYGLQAVVVGDTLPNLKEYPDIPLPVLRPLIGYTEKRLQEEKRKYGL